MRKINNPFFGMESFNCFGCSPTNKNGLKMDFFEDGDYVICNWKPKNYFAGYKNVLHGGIQATLVDEVASWTIFTKAKTAGVTSEISIKYKKPVYLDEKKIVIKGKIRKIDKKFAVIQTQIFNSSEQLCSEADVTYYIYPREVAEKKLGFPDFKKF